MSQELTFGSGARRLAGRLFSPVESAASGIGILFIHGSGSDQRGYAERAAAASESLGATCFTFDLSGHGDSGGERAALSAGDHLEDCVDAFDTLRGESAADAGRIGICAASYGAYLAAMLIANRDVASLLLRAPALYADTELNRVGGPRHSGPQAPATATALQNAADFAGPVLILESEHDELIPHAVVEAYLSACKHGRHRVMRGAGHRLSEPRLKGEFIEIIAQWFGDTLAI